MKGDGVCSMYKARPLHTFCHVKNSSTPLKKLTEFEENQIKEIILAANPESCLAKHHQRRTNRPVLSESSHENVERQEPMHTAVITSSIMQAPVLSNIADHKFLLASTDASKVKIKYFCLEDMPDEVTNFYKKEVVVSFPQATKLCEDTKKQDGDLWLKERAKRITGTTCYELYTFGKREGRSWEEKIKSTINKNGFAGNFATRYGKDHEEVAISIYKQQSKNDVRHMGLVVNPLAPWLGCSPDGVVYSDGVPIKLIEVKCPVAGQHASIFDLVKEKKIPFLALNGENIELKKRHKYYGQCQLGMTLLNLQHCDFVVFCKYSQSVEILDVLLDTPFVEMMLKKLKWVYFKYFLPIITNCR